MRKCIDCGKTLTIGDDYTQDYADNKIHRHVSCDRERVNKLNPTINGVSRIAYRMAGSSAKFYDLPKEERARIRRDAKAEYETVSDNETNVVPTTPKFEHPELARIRTERLANYAVGDAREKAKRDGFVYVIVHPDFEGVCKIGRTRDPNRRLASANTWCPYNKFELHAAVYSEDAIELEKLVHEALKVRDREEVGEWFYINRWHAENLIYKVQRERQKEIDNADTDLRHRSQRTAPCRGHGLADLDH